MATNLVSFMQVQKATIAKRFIPDKTRTASLLNGFKNKPFWKFIDIKILKIDLVWAVKSSKKKRVSSTYKDAR